MEDEVLAQISGKLEKERQRKARLEAGAAQQPSSTSMSGTSPSRQTSKSEIGQTSTDQSQTNQGKATVDTKQSISPTSLAEASAGTSTGGEPVTKKGKPESNHTVEPMETESDDQIAERGRPMETDDAGTVF